MKTKEKIVFAALDLFNQLGERNVTTNHIAAHLEISPGNLYYHYRNKQEIIRAIFAAYSQELLERFSPPHAQDESLFLLKQYLNSIFTLMWKYRFFYSNLPDILSRDERLHQEYIDIQQKLRSNLFGIFSAFVERELVVISDDQMAPFITNLHLIISNWLNYQSCLSLSVSVNEAMIHEGILQMMAIIKSRATPIGLEQLQLMEESVQHFHS